MMLPLPPPPFSCLLLVLSLLSLLSLLLLLAKIFFFFVVEFSAMQLASWCTQHFACTMQCSFTHNSFELFAWLNKKIEAKSNDRKQKVQPVMQNFTLEKMSKMPKNVKNDCFESCTKNHAKKNGNMTKTITTTIVVKTQETMTKE